MRLALKTLALLLLLHAPARAQEPPLLPLEGAIRGALDGNRSLRIAGLDVDRSDRLADSYRAQMLPALRLTVQRVQLFDPLDFRLEKGALGTFDVIGPVPADDQVVSVVSGSNTRVQLRLEQPLTQLHKLGLAAEAQDRNTEATRQELRARRQEVASQVRQAWYGIADAQNALAAAQDALAFHTEFERVVQAALAQGSALPADVQEAQAAVARDRQTVLATGNALQTQKEALNLLLGRPVTTDFRVAAEPPLEPFAGAPEELLEEALRQRPEIQQAAARLEGALAARELQRGDYVPDVGAALTYERQTNTGLLPPDLWMLAVEAQYDLYDGGRRDALIAEKDLQVQQAREALLQARDQVEADVRAFLRRVAELEALEAAARLARRAAEERLRVALQRYEHRNALSRDVLEAQAGLGAARRDYQKTLIDHASARAELDRVLGRDP